MTSEFYRHGVQDSELKPHCPNNLYDCAKKTQTYLGQVTYQILKGPNQESPHYKCEACNTVYIHQPEHLKFAEGARITINGFEPAWVPVDKLNTQQSTSVYTNPHADKYIVEQNLQSIANNTNTLKNELFNLAEAIRSTNMLMNQIIEKNNELMDKLTTDPLASVRKTTSDFELK